MFDLSAFYDKVWYPAFVVDRKLYIPASGARFDAWGGDRICYARTAPSLEIDPNLTVENDFNLRGMLNNKLVEKGKRISGFVLDDYFYPIDTNQLTSIGLEATCKLCFSTLPDWHFGKFVYYPHLPKALIFLEEDEFSPLALAGQKVFENFVDRKELPAGGGIIPTLRSMYLAASLARFRAEELARLQNKERARQAYLATINGRITEAVRLAGGIINSIRKIGNYHEVKWINHGTMFSTVVNDDLRVIHAGICVSGHDHDHTLGSLIAIEQYYQRVGPTYVITRR